MSSSAFTVNNNIFAFYFILFLILRFFLRLLESAIDYLIAWTEELEPFQNFSWISLHGFPDWTTVKNSMKKVSEHTSFDRNVNASQVFEQYGFIKKYCTDEKLEEWTEIELPTDKRWVEIFKHMNAHGVPFIQFSQIIEFALCFPGSSAPVERVFAKAKKNLETGEC